MAKKELHENPESLANYARLYAANSQARTKGDIDYLVEAYSGLWTKEELEDPRIGSIIGPAIQTIKSTGHLSAEFRQGVDMLSNDYVRAISKATVGTVMKTFKFGNVDIPAKLVSAYSQYATQTQPGLAKAGKTDKKAAVLSEVLQEILLPSLTEVAVADMKEQSRKATLEQIAKQVDTL